MSHLTILDELRRNIIKEIKQMLISFGKPVLIPEGLVQFVSKNEIFFVDKLLLENENVFTEGYICSNGLRRLGTCSFSIEEVPIEKLLILKQLCLKGHWFSCSAEVLCEKQQLQSGDFVAFAPDRKSLISMIELHINENWTSADPRIDYLVSVDSIQELEFDDIVSDELIETRSPGIFVKT